MKNKDFRRRRFIFAFLIIAILLFFSIIINLVSGSVDFTLKDLVEVLFKNRELSKLEYNILYKIRIPRILAAMLYGAALSISGFLLQTFFRNPIVGPSVLGISSGAKLFVGLIVLTNLTNNIKTNSLFLLFTASMIGSLLSMFIVLLFARKTENLSMLVVIGIMIGYIASAITNFLITFAAEHKIVGMAMWGLGSFSGVNWNMLRVSAIIIIPSIICSYFISKPLQAFLLGENYAMSLGINIKKFRVVLIILSSILTACVTAFAGPISFVGIAVPHLARLSFKTANPKVLVPAIAITGSTFCLISDYFARTLFSPIELNISVITSLIGAPIVIYLMSRRKK